MYTSECVQWFHDVSMKTACGLQSLSDQCFSTALVNSAFWLGPDPATEFKTFSFCYIHEKCGLYVNLRLFGLLIWFSVFVFFSKVADNLQQNPLKGNDNWWGAFSDRTEDTGIFLYEVGSLEDPRLSVTLKKTFGVKVWFKAGCLFYPQMLPF